jgi:hypothetical protein
VFGGFCLLFVFAASAVPVVGCGFFVIVCFVRFSLDGFCLESLILAQDERWRRA